MRSMTGFGKRETLCRGTVLGVEVRAVNHRFCEILVRLPRILSDLELTLKELVKQACARGRIEVSVTINGSGTPGKIVQLDREAASRYYQALRELQRDFKLGGTIDVSMLAGFREIFSTTEDRIPAKELSKTLVNLTRQTLLDLEKMRRKEGLSLRQDISTRLQTMVSIVKVIQERVPFAVRGYSERLQVRVANLLSGESLDPGRMALEAILYAEKSDVSEEITRLGSHFSQFKSAMKEKEPVGKRLDFLLQEIGREVNTIGSKANDAEISQNVVALKSELEKIREQVQNIE